MTWRRAWCYSAVWLAVAGLLHASLRVFYLGRNLGVLEFFVWGTFVLVSMLLLAVIAGACHRSWKVVLIVLVLGVLLGYVGVEVFQ